MKKYIGIFIAFIFFNGFSQSIIQQGSNWKYLDDGSDQGTAWQAPGFDDSSWASGNAQLGYGDGDEATLISYGSSASNKHITYYFRKTFTAQNTNNRTGLDIGLLRDDGAVVYLNGTEIIRSNMPAGNISYTTPAAHTVSGSDEDTFFSYSVPASLLNNGTNTIAVEVHQRSHTSSDMSFDMQMSFGDYSPYRKAPYLLFTDNNTEMFINWQLKNQAACQIAWGTDTTYGDGQAATAEYNTAHQHQYTITGLTPDTKYYYKVTCDGVEKASGFYSGTEDNATSLSFYAYGDTRTNISDHDLVAAQIMNAIAQDPNSQTFIVSSGDIVANGDAENDWDSQFFATSATHIQQMLGSMPYLASMGNHEGQGLLFRKYFPYPMYINNRFYYSFDYGPVHFTVVDQFTTYTPGSSQYNWIVNDLSSSNKPWKVVLLHKPGWSAGGHSNNTDVQNHIQPLCEQYGVQFVITGHNHYYARATVNNVEHITTGGGGAPLYSPNPSYPNIVTTDESLHFCKLEINNNTLTFSAVRADGTLIESFDYQNVNQIDKMELGKYARIFTNENRIIVHLLDNYHGKIEIFDDFGRLIYSTKPRQTRLSFDINNKGIYFVRIYLNNENTFGVKKVLVK